MFKDIGAGLRNMFGGRSQGYEEELMKARNEAILEMQQRAEEMGAHAVVGVDIDYEVLGADNGMLMVTASGTAVQLARRGWTVPAPACVPAPALAKHRTATVS